MNPWMLLLACNGDDDDTNDKNQKPDDSGITETVDCSDRDYSVIPSGRGEMSGVYDPDKNRLVFFGGDHGVPINCMSQTDFVSETWAFDLDCNNFELLDKGTGPDARARYAFGYDAQDHRMLVHGGRSREGTSGNYTLHDDLWSFDLTSDTWTEVKTTGGPSKRHSHAGAWANGTFYMYGGNTSSNGAAYSPTQDFWSLNLKTLTWESNDTADPGLRIFPSMESSDDGAKLWVYGGTVDFFGPILGDMWEYDVSSGAWTELNDGRSNAPVERFSSGLVYHPDGEQLLVWAGHDDAALGPVNELWSFDLTSNTWTEVESGDTQANNSNGFCDFPKDFIEPDMNAPERRYHGVADYTGSELVIFGGKTDCGIINDVWSWSEKGWTERSAATTGEICKRAFAECESYCF